MYELKNKTAVITGSGRGIGKDIAIALAKNGVKTVVNVKKSIDEGNNTVNEIKKYNDSILSISDVSGIEGAKKLFNDAKNAFGNVDILINNAGIGLFSLFNDSEEKIINKIIKTNIDSTVYCSQLFSTMFNGSVIINISSLASIVPFKGLSIYGMTKAAINGLTRSMALELSGKNIRVNGVAPGIVKTKMGNSLLKIMNINENDYSERYTLTKKIIEPEEVADAVLFLTRNESITGQTIIMDSGQLSMFLQ